MLKIQKSKKRKGNVFKKNNQSWQVKRDGNIRDYVRGGAEGALAPPESKS